MTGFGIGASVKRREDLRLLTGRGRYAEDCNAAGQVYAAFVRSPHAHADVVAIDAAPARAVAGVKGAGEGGTVGAPGAVIHAILDALAPVGVTHIDMPATPERVWRAIRDAR
jgi:CO/xanthine dehydrogenase Mo-binding subunit